MLELFLKYFSRALMLLLVLPLTNCAKGLVAKWQGDDTADQAGRITLNPAVHLDLLGSIAILLIGFGWSKPMPVNFNRMKNTKRGIVLVSLAGPVSHFISAIILLNLATVCNIFIDGITGMSIAFIFSTLAQINTCLGVIDILPIPPMDGFTVLYQFAGRKFLSWYHSNHYMIERVSLALILFLFFIGDLTNGKFDPLYWIITWVYSQLYRTTFWIYLLF